MTKENLKKTFSRLCWDRWWKKTLFFLVTGIVICFLLVLCFLDILVRNAVSSIGTYLTGTGVEVGAVFVKPILGRVAIHDFKLLNPPGFRSREALQFTRLVFDLDVASLARDTIVVEEISLSGLRADFELQLNGSNLGMIRSNLESKVPKKAEVAPADADLKEPEEKTEENSEKKVVIKKLDVDSGTITFSSQLLKTSIPIPLPGVSLTDLGGGRPLSESVLLIYDTLYAYIEKAASSTGNLIPKDLGKKSGKLFKKIKDIFRK